MSLTFHFHPLSSFCQKALIALYENDTAFTPQVVHLGDSDSRAAFAKLWPIAKMPVLHDEARGQTIPEASIIIEYLALHYPGKTILIPDDAKRAFDVREWDRFFDLNLHLHMQKVIGDRIRPEGERDPHGVAHAKRMIETGLALAEKQIAGKNWIAGDDFTMADCAAAPPLFYCDFAVEKLAGRYDKLTAYLERLKQRPSYARALKEAEPFMQWVPQDKQTTT